MKKNITIFFTLLLLVSAGTLMQAQVLTTEDFNYSGNLNANGWSAHSGSGTNIPATTTGLTYSGYLGSGIGNAALVNNLGGEDDNKLLADSINTNNAVAYLSFLVNVTDPATDKTGDYFIHLGQRINPSTFTLFAARFFVKITSSVVNFGLSNTSTATYGTTAFAKNTPYLVIIKYKINTGGNDTTSVWIVPSGVPATEALAGTPEVTNTATAGTDVINAVALRQGSNSTSSQVVVDGIRVVKSWKSINNKLAVLSTNSITFTNIALGASATDSVIVKNDDGTSMNISSVTSGSPVLSVLPTSATLAAGASQKFVVTYTPVATVTTSSAISFISDVASSPDSVFITANGVQPGFTISTKSHGFGNLYKDSTKTDTVTVTNAIAGGSLVIDSVTSSNPFFTVGPTSATLAIGASQKFGVSFTPTAAGVATSNIVFYNNGGLLRDTLKVSGNGVIKAPLFSATPTLKDFHGVIVAHPWKDSVTIKNTGYDSLFISSVASSDPAFTVTPATARIDSQASKKFFITFTPPALGAKSASLVFTSNVTEVTDTVKLIGRGMSIVTIATARKDTNNDLIADQSIIKDTLAITGVITTPNMGASAGQVSFFMQDSTGGIDAFAFGAAPVTYSKGDSVLVIGTAAQFRGLVEFSPIVLDTLHFQILKHNATFPKTKHLTLHQFVTNAESYEGQMIELDTLYKASGTWPAAFVGNVSVFLMNASHADTVQMFLDIDAGIGGTVEPTYPIRVVGFVSQFSSATTVYNNGYEISPRDSLDIFKTKFAPTTKISEARKDANLDLIPDHSVTKDTLALYGVITTPNFQPSQTSYFLQDSTAGINVFSFNPYGTTFVIGDSVVVVGTVAQFRGLTEFTPLVMDSAHFGLLKHNAVVPKAKRLTLHQFVTNTENYEGMLIEIDTLYKASGTWPAAGSNASIFVTNASKVDTTQMFIDLDTDIDGTPELAYPINVVGVGSQFSSATTVYNNGYEIIPRDTFDIHHQTVVLVKDLYSGIPNTYELLNNYPNPFNPSTTILYGLPQQSHVTITVYSVLGQELATLVNDVQSASYYRVVWNGQDKNGSQVSSGVYFFRIAAQSTDGKAQTFVQVKKMMLMK